MKTTYFVYLHEALKVNVRLSTKYSMQDETRKTFYFFYDHGLKIYMNDKCTLCMVEVSLSWSELNEQKTQFHSKKIQLLYLFYTMEYAVYLSQLNATAYRLNSPQSKMVLVRYSFRNKSVLFCARSNLFCWNSVDSHEFFHIVSI